MWVLSNNWNWLGWRYYCSWLQLLEALSLLCVPASETIILCKSIIRFYRHLAQGNADLPREPLQAGSSWDVCRQSPSVWCTVVRKAWSSFFKEATEGKKTGIHLILSHLWSQRHPPFDLRGHWWQALWENTDSLRVLLGYLLLILWPAPFRGGHSQSYASINQCPLHLFLSHQLTSLQP